jgi:3-hydroxybutyryl-CoA dehydratase
MAIIGRSIDEIEVGQTATFTRSFSEEEVKLFADLTWDHNPYHLHPEFVKKARFGKPIVHGLLVASSFCHFGGDFFPGPAILATRADMEFLRPAYPGELLTFTTKVTEVDRDRGRISFVTTAKNEEDEVICNVTCNGIPTAIEVDE